MLLLLKVRQLMHHNHTVKRSGARLRGTPCPLISAFAFQLTAWTREIAVCRPSALFKTWILLSYITAVDRRAPRK